MDVRKKIEELVEIINKANYEYHTLDAPVISDFTYDMYLKELIELEEKYPEYKLENSPSLKVGGKVLKEFKKVVHDKAMLSLSNVFNEEEIKLFYEKIKKEVDDFSIITELKIDGLAVNIKYIDGKFSQASTRGDGIIGEDVSLNVKTIKSLPLILNEKLTIEVRGEIFMPHKSFNKINKIRLENGEKLFLNPRNAAAGTIRQLDSKIVSKRNLDIFIYTLIDAEKHVDKQSDVLKFLNKLGFKVNPHYHVCTSFEEIIEQIKNYDQIRKKLDYDTDGVVLKVNEIKNYDQIGNTAKGPKWATAYKFSPDITETRIKEIKFQVGRTGIITPIAVFDPVLISGSKVSKATLHNYDYIKNKDIRINDYVYLRKAGEIIPEVINVNFEKRNLQEPFKMIEKCPACGFSLKEKYPAYYCLNDDCSEKVLKKIIHFASRSAMNIEGLGKKNIESLFNHNFLNNIVDIYELKNKYDDILKMKNEDKLMRKNLLKKGKKLNEDDIFLKGIDEESLKKIILQIEKSKTNHPSKLLFALGISEVGAGISKLLLNNFEKIDNLFNVTLEELNNIKDIGKEISKNIYEYFHDEKNIEILLKLKELGLNFTNSKKDVSNNFHQKNFVITGTLSSYKREELIEILESLGAVVSNSISKKVDFLIVGKNAGSKLDKAKLLGIKILSEKELIEGLKNEG